MLLQVASLRSYLTAADPWESLSECYPSLLEIVDEMVGREAISRAALIERLVHLYKRYVGEWEDRVYQVVRRGLTEDPSKKTEVLKGD